MRSEESLTRSLARVEVNADFTEAVMTLLDESRLCFCHRVGERWAKAVGPAERETDGGLAGVLLSAMTLLNRLAPKTWSGRVASPWMSYPVLRTAMGHTALASQMASSRMCRQ